MGTLNLRTHEVCQLRDKGRVVVVRAMPRRPTRGPTPVVALEAAIRAWNEEGINHE